MARVKAELPPAEALLALIDAQGRLAVRASAGAAQDGVRIDMDEQGRPLVQVRVTAPADKGRANKAICALLAKAMGLAPSRIAVVAGHTARMKTVAIDRTA